jgi:hypothetical protein
MDLLPNKTQHLTLLHGLGLLASLTICACDRESENGSVRDTDLKQGSKTTVLILWSSDNAVALTRGVILRHNDEVIPVSDEVLTRKPYAAGMPRELASVVVEPGEHVFEVHYLGTANRIHITIGTGDRRYLMIVVGQRGHGLRIKDLGNDPIFI